MLSFPLCTWNLFLNVLLDYCLVKTHRFLDFQEECCRESRLCYTGLAPRLACVVHMDDLKFIFTAEL